MPVISEVAPHLIAATWVRVVDEMLLAGGTPRHIIG
jgi:hypothetical protein